MRSEMSDTSDKEPDIERTPAEENPWYILLTWVRKEDGSVDEDKSRLFWHRLMLTFKIISEEDKDYLIKEKIHSQDSLKPYTDMEFDDIQKQYRTFVPFNELIKTPQSLEYLLIRDLMKEEYGTADHLMKMKMKMNKNTFSSAGRCKFEKYIFPLYWDLRESSFESFISFKNCIFKKKR